MPKLSEDQIHRAVVIHFELRKKPGARCWHTPNGGKRNAREAKKLQRMGVKRGVPDLLFFYHSRLYGMELKSNTGRPTEEQMEWMSWLNSQGGSGCICDDLDRAIKTLETWGLLRGE